MLAREATDTVIDGIVAELKRDGKLKRGTDEPALVFAIRAVLQVARVQARTRHAYWAKDVRKAARQARKALRALATVGPDYVDRLSPQLRHAAARRVPDKRVDLLQKFYGDFAVWLATNASRRPLAGTPAGVVHNIARRIFAYATGEWPSDASLLKACRRALKEHSEASQP